MSIKNENLGGTDWGAEELTHQDLNDTFDATIKPFNALEILEQLRLMDNASLSYNTVNFLDIFSDENGLNNSVDTSNTSSNYNDTNEYYENTLTYDNPNNSQTKSTSYVTAKNYDLSGNPVLIDYAFFSLRIEASMHNATIQVTFTYEDNTTSSDTQTNGSDSWHNYSISNPNPNDNVKNVEFEIKSSSVNSYAYSNDQKIIGFEATNTEIYLNYDKSELTDFYLDLFSDETSDTDIGDVTFQFTDGNDTSSEYNAQTNYNNISLGWTPTQLIIKQNDAESSIISKFVLFVNRYS